MLPRARPRIPWYETPRGLILAACIVVGGYIALCFTAIAWSQCGF